MLDIHQYYDAHFYLEIVSLLLSILGVIIWVWWAVFKNKKLWRYSIAPLTWLVHSSLFYLALFVLGPDDQGHAELFNVWSTSLRLHALFLIIITAMMIPRRHKI